MIVSSPTCRLVLLVSAACNAMTSAEPTVNLGNAGEYAILAKTGISTVPSSNIYGDIAVSPIASGGITGFDLALDSGGQFSTSTQISASTSSAHLGQAFAASYGAPTPTILTAAVGDMETAYLDAKGRDNTDADRINLLGGILSGVTLTPGVYTFGTDVHLTGDITFNGAGVYIIQMTGNLIQDASLSVITSDGAAPENIFWQVPGFVSVGVGAHMEGVILAKTKVDFLTGSSLHGRVLTQTACNLQQSAINAPDTLAPSNVPSRLPSVGPSKVLSDLPAEAPSSNKATTSTVINAPIYKSTKASIKSTSSNKATTSTVINAPIYKSTVAFIKSTRLLASVSTDPAVRRIKSNSNKAATSTVACAPTCKSAKAYTKSTRLLASVSLEPAVRRIKSNINRATTSTVANAPTAISTKAPSTKSTRLLASVSADPAVMPLASTD
jgi:hypothetical protein